MHAGSGDLTYICRTGWGINAQPLVSLPTSELSDNIHDNLTTARKGLVPIT
jgi:hypothetical protein